MYISLIQILYYLHNNCNECLDFSQLLHCILYAEHGYFRMKFNHIVRIHAGWLNFVNNAERNVTNQYLPVQVRLAATMWCS